MVDGEVRFAVALVGSDGAAGHGGDDGVREGVVALAIAGPNVGRLAILVLELPGGEAEAEAAVLTDHGVHGPHARGVLAKAGSAPAYRDGAQARALQRLERAVRFGGELALRGQCVV